MNIGIVGHAADKFTPETETVARRIIRDITEREPDLTIISGACHLGGVDIWADERAGYIGCRKIIFPPKALRWHDGYKPRNIQIASHSDAVHVIVVEDFPPGYTGRKFGIGCYHCGDRRPPHVKSGACWTAMYAERVFKRKAYWHIIQADGTVI